MFANRVKETSASTGAGALTLAGAEAGFSTFNAAFGNHATDHGAEFNYFIIHSSDGTWESGKGHLSGASTLVRDRVDSNSSGTTAAVSFASGGLTLIASPGAADIVAVPPAPMDYVAMGVVAGGGGLVGSFNEFAMNGAGSTLTLQPGIQILFAFRNSCSGVFSGVNVRLLTAADASSVMHWALYEVDKSGLPGRRIVSCKGATASNSMAADHTFDSNADFEEGPTLIPAGDYFQAMVLFGSATNVQLQAQGTAPGWWGMETRTTVMRAPKDSVAGTDATDTLQNPFVFLGTAANSFGQQLFSRLYP